jgi:hypothetical protein
MKKRIRVIDEEDLKKRGRTSNQAVDYLNRRWGPIAESTWDKTHPRPDWKFGRHGMWTDQTLDAFGSSRITRVEPEYVDA